MTPNIQVARKNVITPPLKGKKRLKCAKTNTTSDKENVEKQYAPMEQELEAGINIITKFIHKSHAANDTERLRDFESTLLKCLKNEYTGHWYPERPEKGSAFRCLRVNQNGSESLIEKTAKSLGVTWLINSLPKEFTIWIDPGEVSYRIGEEGSICVHFSSVQQRRYVRAM